MSFPNAKDMKDKAARAAREKLDARFKLGESAQLALIEQVAKLHIIDKLVSPKAMRFSVVESAPFLHYRVEEKSWTEMGTRVHPHAFQQMCNVAKMPKVFVNELLHGEAWELKSDGAELFIKNMDTLFHKKRYLDRSKRPTKFLHRLVETREGGMEIRGFLSRNFNRHLASRPLLSGFVEACHEVGAQPVEASTHDIFFNLKCYLPYVFEPIPGEFIAFGVSWSNSDFGAGRMRVSLCLLRIKNGGPVVLDDALSRVHIGSIIQDSDLVLTEDTQRKEVVAQISAIRDSVIEQLKPDSVERMLKVIELAHAQHVPFSRVKSELGSLLQKAEFDSIQKLIDEPIEDLPPIWHDSSGKPIITRWWVSNAISHLADKTVDVARREELKDTAGNILVRDAAAVLKPSS